MGIEVLIPCEVEGFLDVVACLGTHLEVGQVGLLQFLPDLLGGYLLFFGEVALVTEEDEDGLFLFVVVAEVDPLMQAVEGFLVSG